MYVCRSLSISMDARSGMRPRSVHLWRSKNNASVGKRCKISSHTFICEGVVIEDNVFIGHGVMFINDSYPRATTLEGSLQTEADWKVERTVIRKGASIGSGATILSNTNIGENAIVGAGSVVTKDVPSNSIVAGNPAKILRYIEQTCGRSQCPCLNNAPNSIPFLDLVTPHIELEQELTRCISSSSAHGRLHWWPHGGGL